MPRIGPFLLIAVLVSTAGCKRDASHALVDTTSGKFHVGERWSYNTRAGEESSQITIVKVETNASLGVIVHVSIDGLRIKNPASPGGFTDKIGHMPLSEEAVEKSATRLTSTSAQLPDYREGYDQWRAAFEHEKAGIFTLTVAEAVGVMETILNR